MAKNKLFQELNLTHKPKRNGYDLSRNVRLTAKAGELLPFVHFSVMPDDNVRINLKSFTRTSPMSSDPMTRIREYFDFFFVPYRLLYRNSGQVLTKNQKNPEFSSSAYSNSVVPTKMPWFSFSNFYGVLSSGQSIMQKLSSMTNEFGLNRGALSMKLMNYLGYGYMTMAQHKALYFDEPRVSEYPFTFMPDAVSALPLLAYQKIYYDFFRNTQWENNQPYNYNVDYLNGNSTLLSYDTSLNPNGFWDNPTLFDLRYSNYPKDLFMGVMPESQDGDVAEVEIDDNSLSSQVTAYLETSTGREINVGSAVSNIGGLQGQYAIKPADGDNLAGIQDEPLLVRIDKALSGLQGSFNILEFRQAQFTQKYKEIIGSGKQDYQARIRKIFGVDVPDTLANQCIYLGGNSSNIGTSSQANTNLEGDEEPTIRANGVGSGNGDMITYEPKEHGIIMGIYHCQPEIDYSLNAAHFDVVKVDADDFANPVFDQLGFQELPFYFLNVSKVGQVAQGQGNVVGTPHIGYTTRYFDYKTGVDVTLGDFRETRPEWLAPLNLDYLMNFVVGDGTSSNPFRFELNANFFKVNPSILDPIFFLHVDNPDDPLKGSYVETDQFLVTANIEINAVRPLDYLGVPY